MLERLKKNAEYEMKGRVLMEVKTTFIRLRNEKFVKMWFKTIDAADIKCSRFIKFFIFSRASREETTNQKINKLLTTQA